MKRFVILLALFVGVGCIALPVSAQVRKAERALKKQQHQEALGFVEVALEKKPNDAKAHEVKGRIYQEMASMAEGEDYTSYLGQMREAFDQAASLDGKMAEKVEGTLTLAYIGEFQKGIDAFNAAQNASDNAGYAMSARYFEGCSIIAPDSTGPYVNWAFAMIGSGDDVGAIKPLEMAIERGEPDLDVYNYLSRIYLTNERAADAVPLLEEATGHFPDNEELQNNLLNAYAMSNQIDRAIEVYGQTVANSPNNKIYRYNYGSLLLQAERHDDAIEQLKEAVRIDEAYTDAQYNLGAAYVNKAIGVNNMINEIDDDLRENKSSLSADEISEREQKIDTLSEERRELFGLAVPPLEKAKTLGETAGNAQYEFDKSANRCRERATGEFVETEKCSAGNIPDICRVLYQSYVQTNQMEKVESVQECAGL